MRNSEELRQKLSILRAKVEANGTEMDRWAESRLLGNLNINNTHVAATTADYAETLTKFIITAELEGKDSGPECADLVAMHQATAYKDFNSVVLQRGLRQFMKKAFAGLTKVELYAFFFAMSKNDRLIEFMYDGKLIEGEGLQEPTFLPRNWQNIDLEKNYAGLTQAQILSKHENKIIPPNVRTAYKKWMADVKQSGLAQALKSDLQEEPSEPAQIESPKLVRMRAAMGELIQQMRQVNAAANRITSLRLHGTTKSAALLKQGQENLVKIDTLGMKIFATSHAENSPIFTQDIETIEADIFDEQMVNISLRQHRFKKAFSELHAKEKEQYFIAFLNSGLMDRINATTSIDSLAMHPSVIKEMRKWQIQYTQSVPASDIEVRLKNWAVKKYNLNPEDFQIIDDNESLKIKSSEHGICHIQTISDSEGKWVDLIIPQLENKLNNIDLDDPEQLKDFLTEKENSENAKQLSQLSDMVSRRDELESLMHGESRSKKMRQIGLPADTNYIVRTSGENLFEYYTLLFRTFMLAEEIENPNTLAHGKKLVEWLTYPYADGHERHATKLWVKRTLQKFNPKEINTLIEALGKHDLIARILSHAQQNSSVLPMDFMSKIKKQELKQVVWEVRSLVENKLIKDGYDPTGLNLVENRNPALEYDFHFTTNTIRHPVPVYGDVPVDGTRRVNIHFDIPTPLPAEENFGDLRVMPPEPEDTLIFTDLISSNFREATEIVATSPIVTDLFERTTLSVQEIEQPKETLTIVEVENLLPDGDVESTSVSFGKTRDFGEVRELRFEPRQKWIVDALLAKGFTYDDIAVYSKPANEIQDDLNPYFVIEAQKEDHYFQIAVCDTVGNATFVIRNPVDFAHEDSADKTTKAELKKRADVFQIPCFNQEQLVRSVGHFAFTPLDDLQEQLKTRIGWYNKRSPVLEWIGHFYFENNRIPQTVDTSIIELIVDGHLERTTIRRLYGALKDKSIAGLEKVRNLWQLAEEALGPDIFSAQPAREIDAKELFRQAVLHIRDTGELPSDPEIESSFRQNRVRGLKEIGIDCPISASHEFFTATGLAVRESNDNIVPAAPAIINQFARLLG